MTKFVDKFASFVTANKSLSIAVGIWIAIVWETVRRVLSGVEPVQDLVILVLMGPVIYLGALAKDTFLDCLTTLSEAQRLNKPPPT